MPARRPYASRGVPSRGSVRRTRRSRRSVGLLAAALAVGLGLVWLRIHSITTTEVSAAQTTDTSGGPATPTPASVLAALPLLPPAAPTEAPAQLTRHWEAAAPGIEVDPALAIRLDEALTGVDGQIGVAVKDLGSGRGAVLAGNLELQAASLYKLPVLYTVFDSAIPMSDDLAITDEARSYDTGTMELGVGETLTVAEALERMVTLSDNTSAVMLGGRVGPNRINASIRALGMDTTHYSLDRMTTSALDMLNFLEAVANGRAVSAPASADMVHLLLRQRVNDRIPRLLPDVVQVAHKTGNLPGTVNDVGIVYGPNATVAVAVLVSDATDEATAATGIARVALAVYTYFDALPPVAGRPVIPPAPARAVPPVWRQPRPPTPTPVPPAIVPTPELAETPVAASHAAPTTVATRPPTVVAVAATPAPVNVAAVAVVATARATVPPPTAPNTTAAPQVTPTPPPPQPTAAPTARSATPRPATATPMHR